MDNNEHEIFFPNYNSQLPPVSSSMFKAATGFNHLANFSSKYWGGADYPINKPQFEVSLALNDSLNEKDPTLISPDIDINSNFKQQEISEGSSTFLGIFTFNLDSTSTVDHRNKYNSHDSKSFFTYSGAISGTTESIGNLPSYTGKKLYNLIDNKDIKSFSYKTISNNQEELKSRDSRESKQNFHFLSSEKEKSDWSPQEDELLLKYSNKYRNWTSIGEKIGNKTRHQCIYRYQKLLKNSKGIKWKRTEDLKIIELVEQVGFNWKYMANCMPNRNPEEIQIRYEEKLDPSLKKVFSKEEDLLILKLYKSFGNNWNEISKLFPKVTQNSIKNRCSYLRKMEMTNKNKNNLSNVFSTSMSDRTTTCSFSNQNFGSFNQSVNDPLTNDLSMTSDLYLRSGSSCLMDDKEITFDDCVGVTSNSNLSSFIKNKEEGNYNHEKHVFNNNPNNNLSKNESNELRYNQEQTGTDIASNNILFNINKIKNENKSKTKGVKLIPKNRSKNREKHLKYKIENKTNISQDPPKEDKEYKEVLEEPKGIQKRKGSDCYSCYSNNNNFTEEYNNIFKQSTQSQENFDYKDDDLYKVFFPKSNHSFDYSSVHGSNECNYNTTIPPTTAPPTVLNLINTSVSNSQLNKVNKPQFVMNNFAIQNKSSYLTNAVTQDSLNTSFIQVPNKESKPKTYLNLENPVDKALYDKFNQIKNLFFQINETSSKSISQLNLLEEEMLKNVANRSNLITNSKNNEIIEQNKVIKIKLNSLKTRLSDVQETSMEGFRIIRESLIDQIELFIELIRQRKMQIELIRSLST